jgi:putative transposase
MSYTSGSHTVFHHRYHIVWITKYRYKVLEGALRERIRTIIRQLCKELGVQIVSGVLSRKHVHMFPPHIAVSDFVRRVKGRSSHQVRWSSRTCASATGGGISGLGATSPPRAATSRTMSYFSIFTSTNLPAGNSLPAVVSTRRPLRCLNDILPPRKLRGSKYALQKDDPSRNRRRGFLGV